MSSTPHGGIGHLSRYAVGVTPPAAGRDDESLRRRFDARKDQIRAMPDRLAALKEARKLGREMAGFETEARLLRQEIAEALRDETGWSLQAIADRAELSKGTVQNLLGKRPQRRRKSP